MYVCDSNTVTVVGPGHLLGSKVSLTIRSGPSSKLS